MRRPLMQRTVAIVALCVLVLTACGRSDDDQEASSSAADSTIPFPTVLTTVAPALTEGADQRAAPRWEQVRVLTGTGNMDVGPISISARAIQWRVKWTCDGGTLTITSTPEPVRPGPLVSGRCPAGGEGFDRRTGEIRLSIQGSGPWKATVEQQVDTPLDEPLLPEMATAPIIARGDFYNVDKTGKGTVLLYELSDGRKALRIEPGFEVLNDPDLVVWLSSAASPKTSKEMADSPHAELQALKSTRGSQNYIIPPDFPINPIRSIGLYCVPVPSIYIAAALS